MDKEFTVNNPYIDENIIKYYTNAKITKKYSSAHCNIFFKCIKKTELPNKSIINNILNYIPKINNNIEDFGYKKRSCPPTNPSL